MLKKTLFLTFILSAGVIASEAPYADFEAELRALETNQLKTEELQMRNADAVTGVLDGNDMLSDEVKSGQAGLLKVETAPVLKVETQTQESPLKPRRIRSR